jgi:hypothetical protein
MSAGKLGILAAGTGFFYFCKTIMGTDIHRKLGNISIVLALVC